VRVEKTVRLGGGRLDPGLDVECVVENRSAAALEFRLGLEFALTMLGGGGNRAAWWLVDGQRTTHDSRGAAVGLSTISQGNEFVGIDLATAAEPAADAWWSPIDTISNSETGFERVYQGSCLLLSWPARLAPGARMAVAARSTVKAVRDRAREEAAAAGPTEATSLRA
jgi:alpha-amylase